MTRARFSQRLVGAWELVSYEIIAADGARRPGAYDRGQITYDASGRMSAHLMHSSNKADASPANRRTAGGGVPPLPRLLRSIRRRHAAGTVTHIVEGSSNPSWVGIKQLRYFELSSDNAQLTLSLRDGTPHHAVAGLETFKALRTSRPH